MQKFIQKTNFCIENNTQQVNNLTEFNSPEEIYNGKSLSGYTEPDKSSGLYFNFAVNGKYTHSINKQFSVSGLAGIEMVYGYLAKFGTSEDDQYKNFGMGVNFGVEGGYNLDDKITITAGFDFAWLFINSNKEINDMAKETKDAGGKVTIVNLYMRQYVGATYAF